MEACSCKKDGIFIQTLFPVCRLRGLICWCLVLSLLIQTISPVASEQRCQSPSKDAASHRAHLPRDCQVLGLSPPATLPPVTSRSPSSACSGAETRVAGWARVGVGGGNRSISAAENGKIHSLIERSWLGQEGSESAGFPKLLEFTAHSKAWLGKDQQSCWRQS